MSEESTTENISLQQSTLTKVLPEDLSLDSYLDAQNIEKAVDLGGVSNLEKLPDPEAEDLAICEAVEAAQNIQDVESADVEDISLQEEDLNLPDEEDISLDNGELDLTDRKELDLGDRNELELASGDGFAAEDLSLASGELSLGSAEGVTLPSGEDLSLASGDALGLEAGDLNIPEEDLSLQDEDLGLVEEAEEDEEDDDGGSDASGEESEEESDEEESDDEEGDDIGEDGLSEDDLAEATDIEAPPDLTSIIDGPEPVAMDTDLPLNINDGVPSLSVDDIPGTSGEKQEKKEKKGKKRKRKQKQKGEKGEKKKKKAKRKTGNARKNIRSIIKEEELDAETLAAQNEEFERKKRLQEIQKNLLAKAHIQKEEKDKEKDKDSQLKSLLQAAEEESKSKADNDVVILDEEDRKSEPEKEKDVIDISSDDDCVVVEKEEDKLDEEIEEEDLNNGGSHIDDEINCRDEQGRVLVNIGHPQADPDIFLSPKVGKNIKPHQIGGVRFLYDNLVESLSRFNSSSGFGCILAHSMGLGKTIQMIGFIDIFLRYTEAKTALCIVPINTLQNWMFEFNHWVPMEPEPGFPDMKPRSYSVYLMNDNYKTTTARAKLLAEWSKTGGVLLMGYEMYRLLSSRKTFPTKPKKSKKGTASSQGPEVIDVDEEDKNKSLMIDMHSALVNPGPDVVVCDEGHRIKNSHTGIAHSLKNIRTRRRVVLTGYPLQNNLMEYWCMVDFVRPNFLGTKTEFSNMFERPIMNGQCVDSTLSDIKLMRHRAYVLHSLLEGFVQRRGHTVLQKALPPKSEYVFLIKMSTLQRKLYKLFMDNMEDAKGETFGTMNALKAFAVCCKIWNHPDILYKLVSHQKNESAPESDLDIDTEGGGGPKKKKSAANHKTTDPEKNVISYDWAHELMKDYMPGIVENGGKMAILFELIGQTLAAGEKILVFSQSLLTLNLIEDLLCQFDVPRPDMNEKWAKNKSYFRLDGSTPGTEREKLINQFNDPENKRAWVFLLSTRAGCLGINLIGANRVVVIDASWNPCHDCQAVCRVYRFGQDKPSFIYRLVTDNSLEKKIYDRQVTKQGMSDRVVDELNPENQFTQSQVGNLLHYQDKDLPDVDFSGIGEAFEDPVIVTVLKNQGQWLSKEPFTHESLLIDKKELRLSKREKQLAKEAYARDKKMNISYSRPSYAAFYPRGPSNMPMSAVGPYIRRVGPARPVASVKPMISTPVPMRLKADGKTPVGTIVRPGVTVHQVITTTDIVLPGNNTNTQAGMPRRIPAGQQVLVIKTLKGVYIRTSDGKLFAVRSKTPGANIAAGIQTTGVTSTSTTGVITLTTSKATGALGGKAKTTCTTIVIPRTKNLNSTTPASIKIVRPNITLKSSATPGGVIVAKPNLSRPGSSGTGMLASIYSQTQAVNKIIGKTKTPAGASASGASSGKESAKTSEAGDSSRDISASNSPRLSTDSQPMSGTSSPSAMGGEDSVGMLEFDMLGVENSGRSNKRIIVVPSSSSTSKSSPAAVVSLSTSVASPKSSTSTVVHSSAVDSSKDTVSTNSFTSVRTTAAINPTAINPSSINPTPMDVTPSTIHSAPPPFTLSYPPASKPAPPTFSQNMSSVKPSAPAQALPRNPPSIPVVPPPVEPQPPQSSSPPSTILDLDSMKTTTIGSGKRSQSQHYTHPQSSSQMSDNRQQSSNFSIHSLTGSSPQMGSQYGNSMHENTRNDQSRMHGMQGQNQSQGADMYSQNQPTGHSQYSSDMQSQSQNSQQMNQSQYPGSMNQQSHSQSSMQSGSMFGNPLAHLTAQFGSNQSNNTPMSPYMPKPMYPGHSTSSQESNTSQSTNPEDSQRSYRDMDNSMNYSSSYGGSNNYYNMGSGMSHQMSGSSGGGNQQMVHNPYFPGGGLGSYHYPSHLSMLGQGPGMGYNMPYGMQNPMSNPMGNSMSMMGGHGMMGGGMGQMQPQQTTNTVASDSSGTDNSQSSSQSQQTSSSNPNNQSNVPQMPMPFHPGMYGMAPNPMSYPGMQPFMNTPSMYMPYGMPPMMPFGPMGGMGGPMQSQSSQMGGYSQGGYAQGGYGQSMSQDRGSQDQGQGDSSK